MPNAAPFPAPNRCSACSEPDPVSCNIMVAGYVKSVDLDNARQMFDKMPMRGCGYEECRCDAESADIKLNSITFIGALSACCHSGLVEAGERYFKSIMVEKNVYHIQPNIKDYGCMVDLLGRAHYWPQVQHKGI
ncbi:putative pentatricopeptide [Rosa chinensis]|uniref:Putative pentatricopeptide n=1 Tax=Rosa chinensis TaxID=74649 RepID=A0A2P6QXF5_ROSCH|nr:putative pentatricopeptide [Rosa chinensis]